MSSLLEFYHLKSVHTINMLPSATLKFKSASPHHILLKTQPDLTSLKSFWLIVLCIYDLPTPLIEQSSNIES
jgi:hypothetical protein